MNGVPMSSGNMKISRSALEQFIRCPRCFYLQRKLGLKGISLVPLTLAVATDALLKNEFDAIRLSGDKHPLWERERINVLAFQHEDIDTWRNNFKGIKVVHPAGAEVFGAVDDIWQNIDTGELHIVDYKSTSKQGDPSIDSGWGDGYKRQMEIYQWLFRKAGYNVSSIGYFLYVNGIKEGGFYVNSTEGVMRFKTTLIAYEGNDAWVDGAIHLAVACLMSEQLPESSSDCDTCGYYKDRKSLMRD